jgi:hypothetical protein
VCAGVRKLHSAELVLFVSLFTRTPLVCYVARKKALLDPSLASAASKGAAQSPRNFAPSRFSQPQLGHLIVTRSS